MSFKVIDSCKSFFSALLAPLKDSLFNPLYNYLDGVTEICLSSNYNSRQSNAQRESDQERHLNRRYLLPCALYGVFLLDYLYFLKNPSSHVPIGRHLLPKQIAIDGDIAWAQSIGMLLGITSLLLVHDMRSFEEHFRMKAFVYQDGNLKKIIQNAQKVPSIEGKVIFKLHRKAKKFTELLSATVAFLTYPFFIFNLSLNWILAVTNVMASAWICFTLPYIIMNLYVAVCCFIVNCRYLRIRQRTHMEQLRALIAQSNRAYGYKFGQRAGHRQRGNNSRLNLSTWALWAHFLKTNVHLKDLHKQISGYSLFWSRYLSVFITGLTFMVTYMAFLILKLAPTKNTIAVAFIAYFAFLLLALLLWITLECSVLVVNNKETLKLQRIFTFHTSLAGRIPLSAAIKFDHIEADSSSIDRIGFKLLDSVQINSKMFEMLTFYISSLFMKILQHKAIN